MRADLPLSERRSPALDVAMRFVTWRTPEIAVLLVDDQDLVRSGLRRILRRKDGFVVVAECSDGDEVLDALAEQSVDVVVMDLRMKRVDGIEATRRLAEAGGPPVLALTTFNEDDLLSGVLRAGAAGFVLKDSSAEELIRAVRAVAHGRQLSRSGGDRHGSSTPTASRPRAAPGAGQRAHRARTGCADTDRQGATPTPRSPTELFISGVTVKSHIGRIFDKLRLRDRAAAIVYAYDHGIVAPQ